MGSYSIYCGISNITITEGTKVALLPIYKNIISSEGRNYSHYSLPIFGEYADYGCIDNIEKDFNTIIIEKIHNCSIEDYCENLIENSLKDNDYMWIHKDVYDYLVNYHPKGYERVGSFDMGKKEILKHLGFKYIGLINDIRYNQTWELDGIKIHSDGEYCQLASNNSVIYNISDLKVIFPNKDFSSIENLEKENLYFLFDEQERFNLLHFPFGIDRNYYLNFKLLKNFNNPPKYFEEQVEKILPIHKEYLTLLMDDSFCKRATELNTLYKNMYCGSYELKPFQPYITPQCGEHKIHQQILEKFVEINKQYITEDDE